MAEIYCKERQVYITEIKKARKDNTAVKAGQPYLRVKKGIYGITQYFKDYKALDKKHPIIFFKERHKSDIKLLNGYKKELKDNPKLTPEKYLKNLGWN